MTEARCYWCYWGLAARPALQACCCCYCCCRCPHPGARVCLGLCGCPVKAPAPPAAAAAACVAAEVVVAAAAAAAAPSHCCCRRCWAWQRQEVVATGRGCWVCCCCGPMPWQSRVQKKPGRSWTEPALLMLAALLERRQHSAWGPSAACRPAALGALPVHCCCCCYRRCRCRLLLACHGCCRCCRCGRRLPSALAVAAAAAPWCQCLTGDRLHPGVSTAWGEQHSHHHCPTGCCCCCCHRCRCAAPW